MLKLNFDLLNTNLQSFKPKITKLCKLHRVKSLYAFGSILTEDFKPESDIDLIVEFKDIDLEDYADNYFDFKFSLQDVLKRPIDLLEDKAIKNSYFRKAINEKRQLVYEDNNQPQLSQEQLQRLEESKQQIKQGQFLTNEQADKLVEGWLNEH